MRRAFPLALLSILIACDAGAWTVSGRVTGSTGAGLHPIDIDVHVSSTGALVATPGDSTDAQGFYSISVPAGTYDFSFVPPAGSHLFRKVIKSRSVAANLTLNATLGRGHYLSGRVTNAQGQGAGGVDLDFHAPVTGALPNNVQDGLTDSLGYFTALVDSAIWDVYVIAPTTAHLVPSQFAAVDLRSDQSLGTVALPAGRRVQGTVTDEGFFPVVDSDIDVRPAGTRTKIFTPQDNTTAAGTYDLVLPEGTYDISANAPPGQPYASATARSIGVGGSDVTVPNLMLPPGVELRVRCQNGSGAAVAGVDADVDSLPLMRRLETPNDNSDAAGDIRTLVSTWKFRLTLSPPVATRLLPVRFDSLQIAGSTNLGTVTFPAGHWVSGTILESGTATPIPGANLDLVRVSNGTLAITPGDETDATGFFRIATDQALYRLVVKPPSADWDTLVLQSFRSLNDTTVTFHMTRRTLGVSAPGPAMTLALGAPWPNPARDGLAVRIAGRGRADLDVLDLNGRRVATLYRGRDPGTVIARWDGRDESGRRVAPGVYHLRLTGDSGATSRRVVLLR